jgi:hypothetical protein
LAGQSAFDKDKGARIDGYLLHVTHTVTEIVIETLGHLFSEPDNGGVGPVKLF